VEHRFTSGTILAEAFAVFFGNFVAFALICTLVLAPVLILQAYVILGPTAMAETGQPTMGEALLGVLLVILAVLLTPIATAALTYGVFQHVRGKRAGIADCLTVGLRRLLPVLGVSILTGLIIGIGTLLCVVPGIIAATVLAAAVPAAVIERPGVTGAMARSEKLTSGYRWTVFGVIFGIYLLQFIVNMGLNMLAIVSPPGFMLASAVSTIIFTGLFATAATLVYYHLRKAKEAIDVEEIAAVFD
jgi:hypothetical protein